jgi:inhibitor of cysteine peptidase
MNETLGSSVEMQNTPDTLTITEQCDGETIQVAPGTIVIIKLEAIPGTGYGWHSDSVKSDYLNMMHEPVFLPTEIDSTKTTIGAPEYQVFQYRANKKGTEKLMLSYMRKWEKDKPPLKSFSITVSIQE